MKIIIKVGDVRSGEKVSYERIKNDKPQIEVFNMYQFLKTCDNCIIENVDNFLLYLV
jgi:hypothetical protein